MNEIIELLENLKDIAPIASPLILTILGFFGVNVVKTNTKKVQEAIASTYDNKQDAAIKELKAEMAEMTAYIKAIQFRNSFKRKIKDIGQVVITTQKLSNDFESLILEGTEKAADFFGEIHQEGVANCDPEMIFRQGRAILRSLRSGTGNNQNIPEHIKNKIKIEVAYPALNELRNELLLFQKENYNGKTNQMFEKIVLIWVRRFINEAIRAMGVR